jgi:hypothetical protein
VTSRVTSHSHALRRPTAAATKITKFTKIPKAGFVFVIFVDFAIFVPLPSARLSQTRYRARRAHTPQNANVCEYFTISAREIDSGAAGRATVSNARSVSSPSL